MIFFCFRHSKVNSLMSEYFNKHNGSSKTLNPILNESKTKKNFNIKNVKKSSGISFNQNEIEGKVNTLKMYGKFRMPE